MTLNITKHQLAVAQGDHLASVNSEDIAAIRDHKTGEEVLVVDGQRIPLDPARHHTPVQQVINYCHCNKRGRKATRAHWASLVAGNEE
jgi:hypothetical protein